MAIFRECATVLRNAYDLREELSAIFDTEQGKESAKECHHKRKDKVKLSGLKCFDPFMLNSRQLARRDHVIALMGHPVAAEIEQVVYEKQWRYAQALEFAELAAALARKSADIENLMEGEKQRF